MSTLTGRTLAMFSVALSIALVLSAWNWEAPDTGDTHALDAADSIEVSVQEDSISLDTTSLQTGDVVFKVTNEGTQPHSFAISGPVEEQLEMEVAPQETETLEATLKPGMYRAYCPLEGHRAESVEFTVGR